MPSPPSASPRPTTPATSPDTTTSPQSLTVDICRGCGGDPCECASAKRPRAKRSRSAAHSAHHRDSSYRFVRKRSRPPPPTQPTPSAPLPTVAAPAPSPITPSAATPPAPLPPPPPELPNLEAVVTASGSLFGNALSRRLRDAGPIVPSKFNLIGWLRALDEECGHNPPASPPVSPPATPPLASPSPLPAHCSDLLTDGYITAFAANCGSSVSAADAVEAWQKGQLSKLYPSLTDYTEADAFIRGNPPVWQLITTPQSADSFASELADVCAALYVTLRSGFEVLPRGTAVVPTTTANYGSIYSEMDSVRAEIDRLKDGSHLITWAEAQRRYPPLRSLALPDHVLALGVVIKGSGESRKVRIIVDASRGVARDPAQAAVAVSLNQQMADMDVIPPTRLGSVHQASQGMSRRSFAFKADATDAFLQTKTCDDSHRLVGIEFDGVTYVYDSCCFGLANMPSQQQRLGTIFSRIVMRRWAAAGFDVGPRPGPDQRQAWPTPGDGKVHLCVYLDDWYANNFASKADCQKAYEIFIATADELGLQLQMKPTKTCGPAQRQEFLGVWLCSRTLTLSLSAERIAKMVADLTAIASNTSVTVKELQRIIGVLQWSTVVFACARPYLRKMLDLLRSVGPRPPQRLPLDLTPEARADLDMWLRILGILALNEQPVRSIPLRYTTLRPELYTDASFTGGGYFWGGRWRMWKWPTAWRANRIGFFSQDDSIAICELEALALLVAIRDIAPLCTGRRLVMHVDNLPVVNMIVNLTTRSPACLVIIKELMWLFVVYGIDAEPLHIRSEDNECADAITRTDGMAVSELHEIVSRWTRSHPDTTQWTARPPVRPELLAHIERYDYDPPGRQHCGVGRHCTTGLAFV